MSQFSLPPMQKLSIAKAVAVFCVVSYWLTMTHANFRILTYAIPLLALIAILSERSFTFTPNAPPYFVLFAAGLAMAPLNKLVGWQDLYLMLIGLSPFFFGYKYRITWNQIFYASILSTVIAFAMGKGHGAIEFDPATSKSTFESPSSFVFGLLAVWAALERNWRRTVFAMVLCILTLKRIVVLGAMVSIIMCMLPRPLIDKLLKPIPMLILNGFFIVFIISYTHGQFDSLIQSVTHQSANQLGMGRQAAYQRSVAELVSHPVQFIFHGVGPGGIYELTKPGHAAAGKENIHNDSLKILVEYGGIVWTGFFFALYANKDLRVRIIFLLLNITLLTDNPLIYTYVIFAVGLALLNLKDQRLSGIPPAEKANALVFHRTANIAQPGKG